MEEGPGRGATTRETGHGRTETRALRAAVHVDRLGVDFPHAQQAIKLTRWCQDTRTWKIPREAVYVRRLYEYCGDIPPAEVEAAYYAQHQPQAVG